MVSRVVLLVDVSERVELPEELPHEQGQVGGIGRGRELPVNVDAVKDSLGRDTGSDIPVEEEVNAGSNEACRPVSVKAAEENPAAPASEISTFKLGGSCFSCCKAAKFRHSAVSTQHSGANFNQPASERSQKAERRVPNADC
jgi:hypothetical protein